MKTIVSKCRSAAVVTSNLTLGMLGHFACFFVVCGFFFFFLIFFSKESFRNTISLSNSLDPDQARHFVQPDLGHPDFRKKME